MRPIHVLRSAGALASGSVLAAALALAGCGGSPRMNCVPGALTLCECGGGRTGARACLGSGEGYGECMCDAPPPDMTIPDLAAVRDLSPPDLTVDAAAGADLRDGAAPLDSTSVPLDLSIPVLDLGAIDLALKVDIALPSADLSAPLVDLAGPDLVVAVTTIRAIDTGAVPVGTMVTISGVVVGLPVYTGFVKASQSCKYEAWVQDPNGPAPSGISVFSSSVKCIPRDGGLCECPQPPKTGSPLDAIAALGDSVKVSGQVTIIPWTVPDAGAVLSGHQIISPTVIRVVAGKPPAAVVFNDPAIAKFGLGGSGYVDYEGMLVTIKPPMPKPVGPQDGFGNYTYAGAAMSSEYRLSYEPGDPMGSYTSITGIANPAFGGGVGARAGSDFVR